MFKRKLLVCALCVGVSLSALGCGTSKGEDVSAVKGNAVTVTEEYLHLRVEPDKGSLNDVLGYDGDMELLRTVVDADKSGDYGVFSETCKDVYQFLDEDNVYIYESLGTTGDVGNYDYSGRFAYPEIKTGVYDRVVVDYRSDNSMTTKCYVGDSVDVIKFRIGHDNYVFEAFEANKHSEGEEWYHPTELFATIETVDGEKEVYVRKAEDYTTYFYTLGGFSVSIQRSYNEPYTEEELKEIMDKILLR